MEKKYIPRGIQNEGLTCHYNVVFQSLFHLQQFSTLILNSNFNDPLINEIKQLFKQLCDITKTLKPLSLKPIFKVLCSQTCDCIGSRHHTTYLFQIPQVRSRLSPEPRMAVRVCPVRPEVRASHREQLHREDQTLIPC